MMVYELDENGRFVCDSPDGEAGLENWTLERPPQPCFRPWMEGTRLESGEWVGEWRDDGPAPLTAEQIQRLERLWRDSELPGADFAINQLEDNGQDASEWRAYRQALRDYPASPGFAKCERPARPVVV